MRPFLTALVALLLTGSVWAQGYLNPPVLQSDRVVALSLPYSLGTVTVGGLQQLIQPGTVTLIDNMNSCVAPTYPACNFVYWAGFGTALSVTTLPGLAFRAGTAIVGFITTAGGAVTSVVTFAQAATSNDNLVPNSVPLTFGLKRPLCNAILKQSCQVAAPTLSGY